MENKDEIIRIKSLDVDGKSLVEVYLHGNPTHLESLIFTALMSTPKLKDIIMNAVTLYLSNEINTENTMNKWLLEAEEKARLN